MVDVTIIVVNYNETKLLKNCIDSIINFTKNVSYEIVVVDNNSNDFDINALQQAYPDVVLIKNIDNKGFAAANNRGLAIAQGRFTLFLNNDTLFIENSLKEILRFVNDREKVFVGCKLLNQDGTHQISIVNFDNISNIFGENFFLYKIFPRSKMFNKYYLHYTNPDETNDADAIKGAFIWGRTEDFRKLNGFDERFYFYNEENDLCYRLKNSDGKVIYYPGTSIIHIGGATTDKMPWFRFKNQSIAKIQFYQKHFSGLNFVFALFLHYTGIFIRIPIYVLGGILLFNKFLLEKSIYYFRTLFIYPKNLFK